VIAPIRRRLPRRCALVPARTIAAIAALSAVLGLIAPERAGAAPVAGITIETLPAFAELAVTLDGQTVRTDTAGVARFGATDDSSLAGRLRVTTTEYPHEDSRVRVEAGRLYKKGPRYIFALNVFYRVTFGFTDVDGRPVNTAPLTDITIKSSIGSQLSVDAHRPAWLQGSRVVPLTGGLESKQIYWTVQKVPYQGANVVNASAQRFLPALKQHMTVGLLFFSATFRARDALFGTTIKGSVELTFPDGTMSSQRLTDGEAVFPSLPRGVYRVSVEAAGPKLVSPAAISRNQDLPLKVYTWLDLAILGVIGLFLSLGLMLIGHRLRRHRHATRGPQT